MRNKLILLTFVLLSGCRAATPEAYHYIDIPTSHLRSADIAFRMGLSMQSRFIARAENPQDSYSHIGFVIKCDTACYVLHIEPKEGADEKIKCEPIEEFFHSSRATKGCVKRFVGMSEEECKRLQAKALEYFNSSITFDHDYILSDSSQMYCTELIESIFCSQGISLAQGRSHSLPLAKESVILPSDISCNETLEVIWDYSLPSVR